MKEKKFTPLVWCHLIVMGVFALASVAVLVAYLAGLLPPSLEESVGGGKLTINLYMVVLIATALSLSFGIVYLFNNYGKQGAKYYKLFLLLMVVANLASAAASMSRRGVEITLIAKIIMIVLLLVLTFGKDLGKRNTWIIFAILMAIELGLCLVIKFLPNGAPIQIGMALIRLMLLCTIGLAIRGKYADKDARGTV